ncbi:hypothetical protein L6452_09129 [Arctium lappa]|uniref:Uncharacterized protein n=1 Tax=Arctium lappa TaxID=4217 RepID=A0ACB9DJL7_ARCLA|nr:hypothetical protein L6452_09129 [Arctium lappa]
MKRGRLKVKKDNKAHVDALRKSTQVTHVKDAPPRKDDAITKTVKCSKANDSDFVACPTSVGPSSSKASKCYVENRHMNVQHMRPTTLGWSFDLLKKRESSELDEARLGSVTFVLFSRETPMAIDTFTTPQDETEKETEEDTDRVRTENIKLMDDKITLIMTMKWETENLLESLLAKYPNDEAFANFIYILQDIYKYDIKYGSSGTRDFGEPSNHDNVPQGEEMSRVYVMKRTLIPLQKKARKEVPVVPQPCFDTEISPLNDVKPLTVVKAIMLDKGKGVCLEDEGSLKICKTMDERNHEFIADIPRQIPVISTRWSVRLGDHLRYPYVRKVVDMKVSVKVKRIHEWAQTCLVVLLDNGAKLIRRDLETLASSLQVSPKGVYLWTELLNYEEKYRNKDLIRRYFFITVVMEFFPIFDAGNHYLVVFNFKSPSIVVIDNRLWRGCSIDDTMGTYEHAVEILVMS